MYTFDKQKHIEDKVGKPQSKITRKDVVNKGVNIEKLFYDIGWNGYTSTLKEQSAIVVNKIYDEFTKQ